MKLETDWLIVIDWFIKNVIGQICVMIITRIMPVKQSQHAKYEQIACTYLIIETFNTNIQYLWNSLNHNDIYEKHDVDFVLCCLYWKCIFNKVEHVWIMLL